MSRFVRHTEPGGGAVTTTPAERRVAGRVGDPLRRRDGVPKVRGHFGFSSDLHADRMLHGATARSPHPAARIGGIDISAALAVPGVF
ncbi:MAG: hypothetical protein IT200_08390, partial [Thermoleophilia bacterium]|nr:hypothetical protein [Thermoleophilia bacterium]